MSHDFTDIYKMRDAQSRSLTPENVYGLKGAGGMATAETTLHPNSARAGRDLGPGWKLSPCIRLPAGQTATLMDNEGPGLIRHIWMTLDIQHHRDIILRMYWEEQEYPSVECPIGDFFCNSWQQSQNILALPINVNPVGGFNCYLPMPFRKRARITVSNDSPRDLNSFYYTINYTLETVDDTALFFHAQWRRENPTRYKTYYTLVDGIRGRGQYIGTFMAWQQNSSTWWGEGEMLMYLDGDTTYPTIIGTGTEDYFGGAWGFERHGYSESFSAPYLGYIDVQPQKKPGYTAENLRAGSRFILYRFHICDPIYFSHDLKVQIQCLGWRSEGRYLPLQDDVSTVAYWYQTLPHTPFPPFPNRDAREII